MPPHREHRRAWLLPTQIGLLAAVYLATARFGLQLEPVGGFATLVWPPSGIALAAVLSMGPRIWPGIALGALAANLASGAPLPAALGIAAGNTLEALAAGWLLERAGCHRALDRARDVLALLAAAALCSAISATLGIGSLAAFDVLAPADASSAWRAWWLGDAIADLTLAPLLLVWSRSEPPAAGERRRWLETVALSLALGLINLDVFWWDLPWSSMVLPYQVFPLLVWAASRFAQRGATAAIFTTSAVAVWGTVHGHGPFAHPQLVEGLVQLQAFMGVASVTALLLGAAIGERRHAEAEARRHAVRLQLIADENARLLLQTQQAVHLRDEFLLVASHELRTPLTALDLQLESLRRLLLRGGDGAPPVERLDKAQRASGRLARLVEGLLDVSRIATGQMQLSVELCDLAAIAAETCERMLDEARRAGCELRLQAGEPVIGTWDQLRLEQVVTNLLANAVKYGAGKPIEVRVERRGGEAALRVQDHGIGIPAVDRERIFRRFERAVSSAHYGGLGLGLYITRQIVEAHGGSIRVESAAGEGASFEVVLPARAGAAAGLAVQPGSE